MSTKDTLAKLQAADDDPFDFIGKAGKRPVDSTPGPVPLGVTEGAATEAPAKEETRQISVRLPLSRYKRWKAAMIDTEETQEEVLNRLVEAELMRLGV